MANLRKLIYWERGDGKEEKEGKEEEEEEGNLPISLLDQRIRALTESAVPHNLAQLSQHRACILRYQREKQWSKLHAEQINASRTLQQLQHHVSTLDELRGQLCQKDWRQFDQRVASTRQDICKAIEEYGIVASREGGEGEEEERRAVERSGREEEEEEFTELTVREQGVLIPREEPALQSWEDLNKELTELKDLTSLLSSELKSQRGSLKKVEEEVDSAAEHVKQGAQTLRKAKWARWSMLPVGGALIGGVVGGVVGGPIGALAGLKVGALAAVAAGTAGAVGGAFIGHKRKKALQREEGLEMEVVQPPAQSEDTANETKKDQ